jgi:DNA-binding CsgD family transcriptional regulator
MAGLGDEAEELEEMEDLLPDAVRLAVEMDEKATASAVTVKAETLADGTEVPHRSAAALYCRGLLDAEPTQLLQAAEKYREAGRPLPRAKALEAAAAAFADCGDRSSARAAFTNAFDLYTTLDAAWDIARLQARFRAYGIRRGPHAKHREVRNGWDSLTPTEAKIAALVVQGMSNPQVAAQLFLSPRTVATHVSHILAKLDVNSRIDIAREASLRYGASG